MKILEKLDKDKYIAEMAAKNIRVVDFDKFKGKWIAWSGAKIIASGKNYDSVVKKAEKVDRRPIYDKVNDVWTVVY